MCSALVIPAQAGIQFFLFPVSFPRRRESILFLFCIFFAFFRGKNFLFFVIPAKAGIQFFSCRSFLFVQFVFCCFFAFTDY